jgi:hypothetical protein
MKIWVVPRRRDYCGCEGESEALEGVSVLMGGSLRFEPSELPKQATVFTCLCLLLHTTLVPCCS